MENVMFFPKDETEPEPALTAICRRKAALLIDEQGYNVAGVLMRRGGRLMIVTNEGRCEGFEANEFGGILPVDRQGAIK